MKRLQRSFCAAALCLGIGCGDGNTPGGDDPTQVPDGGGDDMAPPYPAWNPQSPAVCGQTPYAWVSGGGTVLESSKSLLPTYKFQIEALKLIAMLGAQLNVHHPVNYDVHTATIRYQTQDRGKLVDATAMVAWPKQSGKTFPTLLFLHPTLGYTDECSPSASRSDLTAPMTVFSLLAASAGYVAVFPDYLNMRSLGKPSTAVTPYLLMEPTAVASLDAARAAKKIRLARVHHRFIRPVHLGAFPRRTGGRIRDGFAAGLRARMDRARGGGCVSPK